MGNRAAGDTGMMTTPDVPAVPAWLQNGFHRFLRRYLKRHFHRIAVERQWRQEIPGDDRVPLILYGNHPSWWDPLIAHFVHRELLPGRQFYAPIDAASLEQYRVFEKLGFFGVRLDSRQGAREFLERSFAILHHGHTALWMTPEGRFVDPRDPAVLLRPGLAHLCTRLREGRVIPVAIEYPFWQERLPECLIQIGSAVDVDQFSGLGKPQWSDLLADRLRETQRELAARVIARSIEPFECLLGGRTGAGGWYAAAQRIRGWIGG